MADPAPTAALPDRFTIRRVANGWIIDPELGCDAFAHVATSAEELANYMFLWASAQEKA